MIGKSLKYLLLLAIPALALFGSSCVLHHHDHHDRGYHRGHDKDRYDPPPGHYPHDPGPPGHTPPGHRK